MRILYDNLVWDSTITAFSEHPDFLFSDELNDTRLSRVARTVDDDDQWIKFSFAAPVAATYISIINHNFTAGATVKIEANATDVWTAPSFSLTLTISDFICTAFSATQTYQYWRLTVDDASNPDTYIQIGYVYIGPHLTMPGPEPSWNYPHKTTSESSKSNSGQLYGLKKINLLGFEVSFSLVSAADKILIDAWFAECDVTRPMIVLLTEDSLTDVPPLYCNITTQELSWQKLSQQGLYYSLKLSFEECK